MQGSDVHDVGCNSRILMRVFTLDFLLILCVSLLRYAVHDDLAAVYVLLENVQVCTPKPLLFVCGSTAAAAVLFLNLS